MELQERPTHSPRISRSLRPHVEWRTGLYSEVRDGVMVQFEIHRS